MKKSGKKQSKHALSKTPTGVRGLDELTGGGLPENRPTLVCGGAGCGKTLLGMEFIVRGIADFKENGVFVSFEESVQDLVENAASLGFDLNRLIREKKLFADEIRFENSGSYEAGEYDLGGLFARIGYAVDSVGAKRIVLDGIDLIFSHFAAKGILRSELNRLFKWLKKKKLTAIVTCSSGDSERSLSRHGIEEYLSDCVIVLDQRINEQIATRRLHIVKYRGSVHGTNEYPFLITGSGVSVLPVTSMELDHKVSSARLSTGIDGLDEMLEGKGYFAGSSILVSGAAGTGKSSFAAHFAKALCDTNRRCVIFAFEESAGQIIRNMQSIGLDLAPYVEKELLEFHARRPTVFGLERHLLAIHEIIEEFGPEGVILDPVSNLASAGITRDAKVMFIRLLDYLKSKSITSLCTDLTPGDGSPETTDVGISSLMDTWVMLRNREMEGGRYREVAILKSRGMAHSNETHMFQMTNHGIAVDRSVKRP